MHWFFSINVMMIFKVIFLTLRGYLLCFVLLTFSVTSCGRAYFPIELKTIARSERNQKQETSTVEVVPLTSENAFLANKEPYKRRVIDGGNLKKPAVLVPADRALSENYPKNNNPGPYRLGVGDNVTLAQPLIDRQNGVISTYSRTFTINESGFINSFEFGRLRAEGLTSTELGDMFYQKIIENDGEEKFEINISGFNSKKIQIVVNDTPTTIAYTEAPMYLRDVISQVAPAAKIAASEGSDVKVIIFRNKNEYVFSLNRLNQSTFNKVRLFPGDNIHIKPLIYRAESVLVVGETGAQRSVLINSLQRPTLADTIFGSSVLNNVTSDFSQIYVLRKKKKVFSAYHLDITTPTRVNLASKFEMRPDDIVFVATQPLSLYSRTLSQILGSTGLTLEARDTIRSEVGN